MNKVFIEKMIKSKMLEYEAIKEIMPEKIKDQINHLENETMSLFKDIAFDMICQVEKEENSEDSKSLTKKAKKVSVDFD